MFGVVADDPCGNRGHLVSVDLSTGVNSISEDWTSGWRGTNSSLKRLTRYSTFRARRGFEARRFPAAIFLDLLYRQSLRQAEELAPASIADGDRSAGTQIGSSLFL
jgi:hypothetical protein